MTATAAKVNSRSFNLDRYYFSWIPENHIQVQKGKDNIVHKREMKHFHVVVVPKKKMESSCFASGVLDVLGLRNRIMAYFAIVGENEAWVDFFNFDTAFPAYFLHGVLMLKKERRLYQNQVKLSENFNNSLLKLVSFFRTMLNAFVYPIIILR